MPNEQREEQRRSNHNILDFRPNQLVRIINSSRSQFIGKLAYVEEVHRLRGIIRVYVHQGYVEVYPEQLEILLQDGIHGHFTCRECGRSFPNNMPFFLTSNQFEVCRTCFGRDHIRCNNCASYVTDDQIRCDERGIPWCSYCHYRYSHACHFCGLLFHSRLYMTTEGQNICSSCLESTTYAYCNRCHRYVIGEENIWFDDDETSYCSDCFRHISGIRSYSYKPLPKFKFTEDEADEEYKLFLGIELEVDDGGNRNSIAREVKEILPFVYCKNDGSLKDGFEIVTHPCTLKYHIQQPYNEAFQYLIEEGYRSGDTRTCGLHIHINRDFFGRSTVNQEYGEAKLLYLMEKYWQKMVIFSRRPQDELDDWARRAEDYDPEDSMLENLHKAKGKGRYFALNFENERTIEFRLFKGTLNLRTFFATLQLVDVFTKYAKNHIPEELQESNWEDIFKGCLYPELKGYLFNRKLLKEEVILCA